MSFVRITVLFIFLVFLFPHFAFGHTWGTSYIAENGEYTVDVGYSSPAPSAGESVIFDFELQKDGKRFSNFSDVWVRVERKDGTVLATGIHNSDFGGARMSYVFPDVGDYTINARYENGTDALTTVSFPLTIIDSNAIPAKNTTLEVSNLAGVLVGFLLGALAVFFITRRKQ